MKLALFTTYYYPNVSGLTFYFKWLAEAAVREGYQVTVVSAQFKKNLSRHENIDGVKVLRSPYLFKINKGLFLYRILWDSFKIIRNADIIHFNLPAFEALPLAIVAKLFGKKIVSTYVCDIYLPRFWGSKIIENLIDWLHILTLKLSNQVVSFTSDFANNSRVLKSIAHKVQEIYPPVLLPLKAESIPKLKQLKVEHAPIVAMATRFASEKGIDIFIDTFTKVQQKFPRAHYLIAGNIKVIGETSYWDKMQPLLKQYESNLTLLGNLTLTEMNYFYQNIDVLVVASTNSTEAYGMVQIEAMLNGTPVVATDLPGVRVPIMLTGMGQIAKVGSKTDLAAKIIAVLQNRAKYSKKNDALKNISDNLANTKKYFKLYQQLLN